MTVLIFDTETTGLPVFKESSSHPDQPHIVQLAAILEDDEGNIRSMLNCIIKPDGKWQMAPEALAVHGISVEVAEKFGLPEKDVYGLFWNMLGQADILVAHNISFDFFMLRIAAKRNNLPEPKELPIKKFCTVTESKNIVQLPPTERMLEKGVTGFKPPNLNEAYRHFYGQDIVGAHNAMNDAKYCRKIYHAIRPHNAAKAA